MKIPSKLKVGGHIYRVSLVNGDNKIKGIDAWGKTYNSRKEILINKDMDRSQTEQTFIHELLHCVDAVYNADKLEEEDVMRLSEGLYQVLKDNNLLRL